MGIDKPKNIEAAQAEERFRKEIEVNGMKMQIEFDEKEKEYVLYFPQIDPSKNEEVPDQVIRISKSPIEAAWLLKVTGYQAREASDVYDVYKYAENTLQSLRSGRYFGEYNWENIKLKMSMQEKGERARRHKSIEMPDIYYVDEVVSNNIAMGIRYFSPDGYTIILPEIHPDDEKHDYRGIIVSKESETAKIAFEDAKNLAKNAKSAEELYEAIEKDVGQILSDKKRSSSDIDKEKEEENMQKEAEKKKIENIKANL